MTSISSCIIFEDDLTSNFYPLSLTRPVFDQLLGSSTLLRQIIESTAIDSIGVNVRKHLIPITRSKNKDIRVNQIDDEGDILLVNSLINPKSTIFKKTLLNRDTRYVAHVNGNLASARLPWKKASDILERNTLQIKGLRRLSREYDSLEVDPSTLFKYPWDLLGQNGNSISPQHVKSISYKPSKNIEIHGPKNRIIVGKGVDLEPPISIDVRRGPVLIGDGSKVEAFSRLEGPCFIGKSSSIRSASIRSGSTIGNACVIGGEVDASIFNDFSNKAHNGYIGNSIIGSWVNLGAMTTNSNLKNTYGEINMKFGRRKVQTGLQKWGCIIGDNAKTSIGALIYASTRLGVGSQLHGWTAVDIPSFTISAQSFGSKPCELDLNSAIRTQRRMMIRRGLKQSDDEVKLLRDVFRMTRKDRLHLKVQKGRFRL